MSEILKIEDLNICIREEKRLVDRNISFSVESGDSMMILGESGSGKTMLCRAILNLLSRKTFETDGKIIFDGEELCGIARKDVYGSEIVFIPQNPMTAFDPSMRIGKQLAETYRLHKKTDKRQVEKAVKEALCNAGLENAERVYESYPHTLSGGMLQRAVIAMAIMMKPKLILADEPVTALDAEHRSAVIDLLRRFRDENTSVVLITHDFVSARRFGGNTVIMKDGEIIEYGTIEHIYQNPKSIYCRRLIDASQLSAHRGKEREAC